MSQHAAAHPPFGRIAARAAVVALGVLALLLGAGAPNAGAQQALFDLAVPGPQSADPDRATVELGVRFETRVPFLAEGVALHRAPGHPIAGARVYLWEGERLIAAGSADAAVEAEGWVRVRFDAAPPALRPGVEYVASYTAQDGAYVATPGFFAAAHAPAGGSLRAPAAAGVYAYRQAGQDGPVRPTEVWEQANYWVTPYGAPVDAGPWALFAAGTAGSQPAADDPRRVEVGVRFGVAAPPLGSYRVTAVRYFRPHTHPMVENRAFVYDRDGDVVAHGLFIGEGGPSGVVDVRLAEPLELVPGETYTASYVAEGGHYAFAAGAFAKPVAAGPIGFPAGAGVFSYGGGFPAETFAAASYFVSPVVVLDPGTAVTAPTP